MKGLSMVNDYGCYVAPDPTPEQFANAKDKNYDPYNRLGSGLTDLSASNILSAAGVLHDIYYLIGGPDDLRLVIDGYFSRDCNILAKAVDDLIIRDSEIALGELFSEIVDITGSRYWENYDRNTPITYQQDQQFALIAKRHMNCKAKKINYPKIPYPEAC